MELKKEDMPIEKITETERFSVFYSIRAQIGWGNESTTLWSLRVSFCNFLPNRDQYEWPGPRPGPGPLFTNRPGPGPKKFSLLSPSL